MVSHKAAIETLSYFFSYTRNKPELQREITIPSLPRFNQLILGLAKDEVLLVSELGAGEMLVIHEEKNILTLFVSFFLPL